MGSVSSEMASTTAAEWELPASIDEEALVKGNGIDLESTTAQPDLHQVVQEKHNTIKRKHDSKAFQVASVMGVRMQTTYIVWYG